MKSSILAPVFAGALFVSSGIAAAALPTRGQDSEKAVAERTAIENAKVAARAGSVAATEQALASVARAKSNTAEWHLELARRLLLVIEPLAREAQAEKTSALVNSALAHLDQTVALTNDNRLKSTAKTFAGFLHERHRGDLEAARASYQSAADLAPEKAAPAKEALQRLGALQAAVNPGK
jgi:hypothetical protein